MPNQQSGPQQLAAVINRRYPGAIKFASDPSLEITRLPVGILSLDFRLGGGLARGRHIEVYGGFNVGKTYTAYKLIATTQAAGLVCAFIDVEGTFDPIFAASCGVDLEALVFPERRNTGNRLIDIMETLLRSGEFDVIVLDSIAALLPKAEMESDMEQGSYGTHQARLMSAALRRLTTANQNTVLFYINQTRDSMSMFSKTVTSGGRAMGFYAGTRLEMVRTESIKRKAKTIDHKTGAERVTDVVKGHRVLVKVEKDKTGGARPQSETTFVFDYDIGGVDPVEDLIYLGRVQGFIHVSGIGWWMEGYEDEKQQGRPKFKKWLRRNVAVAEELEEMILEGAVLAGEEDE